MFDHINGKIKAECDECDSCVTAVCNGCGWIHKKNGAERMFIKQQWRNGWIINYLYPKNGLVHIAPTLCPEHGYKWLCKKGFKDEYCKKYKINIFNNMEYNWFEDLREGDLVKSNAGDWHRVLRIDGQGYNQETAGVWSIQHNGEPQSRKRITLYDGCKFMRTISIEDMDKQYTELYEREPVVLLKELEVLSKELPWATTAKGKRMPHPYSVSRAVELLKNNWPVISTK